MKITMTDLAKICGVSRGTIDRALNGRSGINSETKGKIIEIAQQYNYEPNLLARSMATGKTKTIGIVVFDLRNRHFAQMINSIQQVINQSGYLSYICITEKNTETEKKILKDLMARKVDGIIMIPINLSKEIEEIISSKNFPLVCVSNKLSDLFSYVGSDFYQASILGMMKFYEKGYRDVSFICPCANGSITENVYAQLERAKGYQYFMKTHPDMYGKLITDHDYCNIIQQEYDRGDCKKGYFCSSDFYALNILHYANQHHLHIPEDFGLMGFDQIDILDYLEKPLSTLCYPINDVAKVAINHLMELIDGSTDRKNILLDITYSDGFSL